MNHHKEYPPCVMPQHSGVEICAIGDWGQGALEMCCRRHAKEYLSTLELMALIAELTQVGDISTLERYSMTQPEENPDEDPRVTGLVKELHERIPIGYFDEGYLSEKEMDVWLSIRHLSDLSDLL